MKLARPDVFHPRIVLAGSPRYPAGDRDDAGLVGALRDRGLHARWLPWDHPETARADLVILRAARDYAERLDEFLAWTGRVPNLLNPPAVVRWNTDRRRYLSDLAERGVPTVPGELLAPGERIQLPRTGDLFVSPVVGTGSRQYTVRSAAGAYIRELHAAGQKVLVQNGGQASETVLIFLAGRPSHAFVKQARTLVHAEPDYAIWVVAAAALDAMLGQLRCSAIELLYGRVRVLGGAEDPRVLEVQLVDPSLGWRRLDAGTRSLAERDFVLAVESALQRLGLGPLSHRRP